MESRTDIQHRNKKELQIDHQIQSQPEILIKRSNKLNCSFIMEGHKYHILTINHGVIRQAVPAHSHSRNSFEVHYISQGHGSLFASGTQYTLSAGSLFITGPGIMHRQEPDSQSPMLEDCVYFYIEDSDACLKNAPVTRLFQSNPFWYGRDCQNLSSILLRIHQELPLRSIGHTTALNACFQEYLIALARNMTSANVEERLFSRPVQLEIESAFLYRYRDLSLDDICSVTGMCRRQTQRLLTKYYGCGFQKKRTQARMAAAADYITQGGHTSEEIAELIGYSSPSSFLQAFKTYYHMTPGEYRKDHAGRSVTHIKPGPSPSHA